MEMISKIEQLKKQKNAVLLAHNYQRGEVQDIADYVGDSLGLSRKAAETDADVIVFAGVHFMAETAKILSPEKTVLLPDKNAGCPMANMVTPKALRKKKEELGDVTVVCYVNSSVEIKAESDICCTSSNAVQVVKSVPEGKKILFVPDQSLAEWTAEQTGRKIHLWEGYCPTHHRIRPEHVAAARQEHPDAELMVHPECVKPVRDAADFVGSTGQIISRVAESKRKSFLIGTETGIIHTLKKENPEKEFYPVSPFSDCPNMKLCTVEKILWSLEDNEHEVKVDPEIQRRARSAIQKMLEVS